jgi:predicted ester cyclase
MHGTEFANDNWMAATGIVTGTHMGEYLGLKPTGKKIWMRFSGFWSIKDGKLGGNWAMIDNIDFSKQLGIDLLAMVLRG